MTEEPGSGGAGPPISGTAPGRSVVRASWAGTALLGAASALGVATPAGRPVAAVAALVLNLAGVAGFFWAYAVAVRRSRTDAIGIGGLFFLAGGVAPARVRRSLLASLAAQVVVALAAAAARPYTSLAFGVLAPLHGLAMAGLWSARWGRFPPRRRSPPDRREAR